MKKRIAIYYHTNFGRNDGPPLYYYNALNTQFNGEFEVMHLAPEGDTTKYGKFDYHFWVDYGEDGLPVDHNWRIPQDGGKTIYVSSDTHINQEGKQYRFETAKRFDDVFFNQKRALQEYKAPSNKAPNAHNAHWLPHAAEPKAFPKFEIIKKYDVCFIGHIQEEENHQRITRVDFLDYMFKAFPNFYFGTRNPQKPEVNMFEDASKKFSQSKIVLNISIKDDVNMRIFEVLSSGSFLLTNWLPTLDKLPLIEGIHLATYKTLEQAKEKVQYYLDNPKERERIAAGGHKEFLENHTYKHRIEEIFKIIKGRSL